MQTPHCDSRVLHAPGICTYCDTHPEWQELRRAWGIAYTAGAPYDDFGKELLLCPSEIARPIDVINKWPGNRPVTIMKNCIFSNNTTKEEIKQDDKGTREVTPRGFFRRFFRR